MSPSPARVSRTSSWLLAGPSSSAIRPKSSVPRSLSTISWASLAERAEVAGGGLGYRPTYLVAQLGLAVPAFKRTQEKGVRVDAHGGYVRLRVQGPVAE